MTDNHIKYNLPPKEPTTFLHDIYYYGFLSIIEKYCHAKYPKFSKLPVWQHGWIPDQRQIHPAAVHTSRFTNKDQQFFVARKSEELYLRQHGFRNTLAIGSPVIYIPELNLERIPNSLLVMPTHSLDYTTHKHWQFENYANYISSIRSNFSEVVICLHPSCIRNGYWIKEFKKYNFPVVEGTDIRDQNALLRLKALFTQFEYVTTNGFGSHLVYASYFGAKVSINGPFAAFKKEDFKEASFYKKYPELLDYIESFSSEENIKALFPEFFVVPDQADIKIDWARVQLGFENKISPDEMIELLGWNKLAYVKGYCLGVLMNSFQSLKKTGKLVKDKVKNNVLRS